MSTTFCTSQMGHKFDFKDTHLKYFIAPLPYKPIKNFWKYVLRHWAYAVASHVSMKTCRQGFLKSVFIDL